MGRLASVRFITFALVGPLFCRKSTRGTLRQLLSFTGFVNRGSVPVAIGLFVNESSGGFRSIIHNHTRSCNRVLMFAASPRYGTICSDFNHTAAGVEVHMET